MLKIKAIRNNSVFEKQCQDYSEWALQADRLLSDGFMVLVDEESSMFSVVNSKDEVVFLYDKGLTKEFFQC